MGFLYDIQPFKQVSGQFPRFFKAIKDGTILDSQIGSVLYQLKHRSLVPLSLSFQSI